MSDLERWLKEEGEPPPRKSPEWDKLVDAIEKKLGRPICGAKRSKATGGWPCRRYPHPSSNPKTPGSRPRCKRHGGTVPTGIAHPRFKHGGRSYHVPKGLQDTYQRALQDPDYLSLRADIALAVARQQELLDRIDTSETTDAWETARALFDDLVAAIAEGIPEKLNKALDNLRKVLDEGVQREATWDQIRKNSDHIRKLSNTERQRLEAAQQYLTAEAGATLVVRLLEIMKRRVEPYQLREIMTDIRSERILRMLGAEEPVLLSRGRDVTGEAAG